MEEMIWKRRERKTENQASMNISVRVFLTVMVVLIAVLLLSGALSYCVPQGSFLRDEEGMILTGTYEEGVVSGIAPWRVMTAPARVYASSDGLTIIMISAFLLMCSP